MRRFNTLKLNRENFELARMTSVLVFFIILLCFVYVYCVQSSVVSVVERERINKEIASVSSRVSDLEATYLSMRNSISIEVAVRQGFKEDFNKINFANVSTGDAKGRFSFLNNEI